MWFVTLSAVPTYTINTSTPYWIVSTSTSRWAGEGLYLDTGPSGGGGNSNEGPLRGWKIDWDDPDMKMCFWLWPVDAAFGETSPTNMYYMVGTKDSRKAGYMVYLDGSGESEVAPFDPETTDPKAYAYWKFVETTPANDADTPAFHIVSGPDSRYADEM